MPELEPTALPYVVSADLEKYAPRFGFDQDQLDTFRESLVTDLESQGKMVQYVEYTDISGGMRQKMHELHVSTKWPLISIDRNYVDYHDVDSFLDITRANNQTFTEKTYHQRKGTPELKAQFDGLGAHYAGREVILADDVLFTGDMLEYVVEELNRRKIRTKAIVAGVAIGDAEATAAALGVDVIPTIEFTEVEDEICERDFTLLPGAGKYLYDLGKRAMYWLPKPYSNHESMASITEEFIAGFFERSLARNVALLGERAVLRLAEEDVFGKDMIVESVGGGVRS